MDATTTVPRGVGTTRRRWPLAVAAVVIGLLVTLLAGPRPLTLGPVTSGDRDLGERTRAALGTRGHDQVAVALVENGRVRYAGFGDADERTPFEIGSVGKALTGMLLADLAEEGTVRLDEPVGRLVPGTPLAGAEATLQELAQHRSGLPRLTGRPVELLRHLLYGYGYGDPYTGDARHVLDEAAAAGAPGGAGPAYSNLGGATLGNALAVRAGTTYPDLLRARLLEPLGMTATTVAVDGGPLPAGRATGRSATTGVEAEPWVASGWAPAGIGVWSTAADLARLAAAALNGTAPGVSALEPTAPDGEDRIGLHWYTSRRDGRTITWHNGGTRGFHAFVGLDREADRAVVVLSGSSVPVDDAAVELLTAGTPTGDTSEGDTSEGDTSTSDTSEEEGR